MLLKPVTDLKLSLVVRQRSEPSTSIESQGKRLAESVHEGTTGSTSTLHRKCQRTVKVDQREYHDRHSRTLRRSNRPSNVTYAGGL